MKSEAEIREAAEMLKSLSETRDTALTDTGNVVADLIVLGQADFASWVLDELSNIPEFLDGIKRERSHANN